MLFAGFIFPFLLASIVNAAPGLELVQVQPLKRLSITALSSAKILSFTPFTFFASTAYCDPSTTIHFSCGGMSSILSFSTVLQDWTGGWPDCEQQIALQIQTSSKQHREATVALCSSVSVTYASWTFESAMMIWLCYLWWRVRWLFAIAGNGHCGSSRNQP